MDMEYGTITEYFFTTVALAHCGVIPTLNNFTENITIMQDIEKKMEMIDKNSPTCKTIDNPELLSQNYYPQINK